MSKTCNRDTGTVVAFWSLGRKLANATLCLTLAGIGVNANAEILAPITEYTQFSDSPFSGRSYSYFHLETFEDGLLNTPGVTASVFSGVMGPTSKVFGPTLHDSVDADDGVMDKSGLRGDSFFASNGASGITFTFDSTALGSLPNEVGLVWTDGSGHAVFTAYDINNNILGSIGPLAVGDYVNGHPLFDGGTKEDRFFGIKGVGPIKRILIANTGGGIEIDHLQYGYANPVPEPETYAMLLAGLGLLGLTARRRKRKLNA